MCFKAVLRQAQHERNIDMLRQHPFVLSLSKHCCFITKMEGTMTKLKLTSTVKAAG